MSGRNKLIVNILLLVLPLLIFFLPILLKNKVPIPADTIVGMYHPFRDVVWKDFSAGVPFKNFLITDAVRQQYPWRSLAIELTKKGEFPGWNPYTHLGTPLAANIQTAFFYPLNFFYFFLPFYIAWTIQVMLQPILLSLFMWLYLRNLGFSKKASTLSSLAISLSGFSIAWLEWNTTLNTLVWLPLALLAIDKVITQKGRAWYAILFFSLSSIIFSGFLQTAFYTLLIILIYFLVRIKSSNNSKPVNKNIALSVLVVLALVIIITGIQWIPTFRLISQSARRYDQGNVLSREDWFLPWQNLIQFIAPDFFGNPATLNYWGIFNYMEYVGYLGIIPLCLALIGLTSHSAKTLIKKFFAICLFIAILFATSNPISKIPFLVKIPLLSTAQPSRLIMIIVFCLAVLSAFGAEKFFQILKLERLTKRDLLAFSTVLSFFLLIIIAAWIFVSRGADNISAQNLKVSKRNLILPTALFSLTLLILSFPIIIKRSSLSNKLRALSMVFFIVIYLITLADLLRFATKFTPFSDPDFLYPSTKIIEFLKSDESVWRYMTTDRRIFPPNFSIYYKMQTIEGYDPIYLARFGQLIASAQNQRPMLNQVSFKRIIRPDNFHSSAFDVLNVKYILSLSELNSPKLKKVFQEGETRVYQNTDHFPRAFLLPNYQLPNSDEEALKQLLSLSNQDIIKVAEITKYSENQVKIEIDSPESGMLVLADSYYPGWQAYIDGKSVEIERVLFQLRGTMIQPGKHEILYRYSQL